MQRKRILIASPAKGGVGLHYIPFFEEMLRNPPEGWDVEFLCEASNSMLCISRNILANAAVTKGFYRVLMLDTDHPVTGLHVRRILSHDHEAVPIVSGLYAIKRPGRPFWLGMKERGAAPDENGLLSAAFLPTGFLSISVDALRQMQAFHKDREVYIQDDVLLPPGVTRGNATMTELFPVGACGSRTPGARLKRVRKAMATVMAKGVMSATKPQMIEALQQIGEALTAEGEPGYLLGEDYHFSLLARQAGVKMFLDTRCFVPHRGSVDLPIFNPAAVATDMCPIPEPEGDYDNW